MGRVMCEGCRRPQSVCLCDVLPTQPLSTTLTQLVVLQHPHERRHKLATASIVAACLSSCQLLVGRQFRQGSSPILDSVVATASWDRPHVLLLFPCAHALDLRLWCASNLAAVAAAGEGQRALGEVGDGEEVRTVNRRHQLLLLVVDGTWQHAREMVKASMPYLSRFPVIPVCFPCDATKQGLGKGEELILRKEPFAGCMSTLEAVARALAYLEPDGAPIQHKLLSVLRKMVAMQATPKHASTDDLLRQTTV